MNKVKRTVKVIQSALIERLFNKQAGYMTVESADLADIIVFPGGADVNPAYYGQDKHPTTHTNGFDDQRDDRYWKQYSKDEKRMLVGICRGGQFLNVMNGGQMWQDVNNHGIHGTHKVIDLLNDKEIQCTSTHHQMMVANEKEGEVIGIAYEATRWENDKLRLAIQNQDNPTKRTGSCPKYDTEVVWYPKTRSLCFQPHPENYNAPDECKDYFFDLIDRLI